MTKRPTTIERAFQLARSGNFETVESIRSRLLREGFHDAMGQISGPMLVRQLRDLCDAARAERAGGSRGPQGE